MRRAISQMLCLFCTLPVMSILTHNGECVEIWINNHRYPCTDDVKAETGCWDDNGQTQLCDADWIEIST